MSEVSQIPSNLQNLSQLQLSNIGIKHPRGYMVLTQQSPHKSIQSIALSEIAYPSN